MRWLRTQKSVDAELAAIAGKNEANIAKVESTVDAKADDKAQDIFKQQAGELISATVQQVSAQFASPYSLPGVSDGSKYRGGLSGADIFLDHKATRKSARRALFETPQAKALVQRRADTVAGVGLRLDAMPNADILGLTSEQAVAWAENVEQLFDLWASDPKQSRSGIMSFYQSHRFYEFCARRDGENFIRFYYSKDQSLLNPLQFEFIDPDQLHGTEITTTEGLNNFKVHDGIVRNAQGREIGYKVWVKKGDGTLKPAPIVIPAIGSKSKRIMMIHCFVPEFAGQGRGFSPLAHALQEFQKITDFSLAHIEKAITQSMLTVFLKPSKDADAENFLAGLNTEGGAGPDTGQFGKGELPSVAGSGGSAEFKLLPEATVRVPGSVMVGNAPAGMDLVPIQSTAPSDSFEKFVDAFMSYLAASMSMPKEVLKMEFGSNYSASRAALLLYWETTQIDQRQMAHLYLNKIYEMFLAEEIAAGRISAPGWRDPRMKAAWTNCDWIGPPMPNIDPNKTADAVRKHLEMSLTTPERESRILNGSSAKKNRAANKIAFADMPQMPRQEVSASGNTVGD